MPGTSRSAKQMAKDGDQETRGHRSTCSPLNSRCSGPSICDPSICKHLAHQDFFIDVPTPQMIPAKLDHTGTESSPYMPVTAGSITGFVSTRAHSSSGVAEAALPIS